MAETLLGTNFDIHGGGIDLVFPHHENEAAQTRAARGEELSRIWMHNGMLQMSGEKMAKSVGNIATLADVVAAHGRDALVMFFAGAHYRQPVQFSDERMAEAADRADAEGVALAVRDLERVLKSEARTICEKYISPPLTTDFGILFLPTEGLYAEVMRRPGLADEIQRTCRISIAGPSTLCALLNSLQMGFRTLALEKRSSEVWQVLGAVKTEFGKFGDVLATTKLTLERAAKNIEQAETRSRQMSRKLKSVEALPAEIAQQLLGSDGA